MKVLYTVALMAVVASASSTESQKSSAVAVPSPVQPMTAYPGPSGIIPYPHLQSNQFAAEFAGPLARSSFGPKTAVPSSAFNAYQPYQHQYNFGPHQQYYPGSGYPAAAGLPYPTAYSAQPTTGANSAATAAYPSPYSAYPYSAQPYSGGAYSPYSAAYPSYYGGQFGVPSAAPYNSHYSGAASPTVTPYSALPSGYQQQQQQPLQHSSSFYNSGAVAAAAGQQYGPSQQYLSQQQYPSQQYLQSFYGNSPVVPATAPATAADQAKASAEKK